jgi:hypothetical protein
MRATINEAILIGGGVDKPFGLLNPKGASPFAMCRRLPSRGLFRGKILVMPKFELPMQWHSYLLNRLTAALLLTMSDGMGTAVAAGAATGSIRIHACGQPDRDCKPDARR